MKIKQQKQLNLPQLIEYAWENDVRDSKFQTVKDERGVFYEAYFSEDGSFYSNDELDSNDLFTVEIEELITEDTRIPTLVEIYKDFLGGTEIVKHEYKSINKVKDEEALYFYILNDDLTMSLIWRDGKVV